MNKRIALVGASSTGKTTSFELLKTRLPKYGFVNESTRTVQRYGFPINEDGTDATQLAISSFHLEVLLYPGHLVLDRCYMDLVAYSAHMENLSTPASNYIISTWHRVKKQYTHFIYFPIEFRSVDDGVRSISEEWRHNIDRQFQELLKGTGKEYLTVTGSPMQRISQILKFIEE